MKLNIIANYVSQIYITLLGIIILPLYIKYMGAEAYGLVGFFSMLQAWFNLLDIGLTPTMARETARFRGGATDAWNYLRFVRALEGIFFVIALFGGGVLFISSGYISSSWLKSSSLSIKEIKVAVQIMALIIAMRWMCGLYRGSISGSERLVWLGWYNSFIATLRFIGVLPVLIFIDVTPTTFFSYQLIVAIIELAGLILYSYHLLPSKPEFGHLPWSCIPLKPVLKFSLTIAFTSSVWVLVTQSDKLILSKILPLADYGYFTLAVLVASGVMVISGPVSGAIMPRMARLEAEGDHAGLISIYRKSTQLVALVGGSTSITIAFCAESLLWAWTGDVILAQKAAPILRLYALGNGILSVSAFPYYLQYAKGDLRLHLIGNAIFVVLLIPATIWATISYGGLGAGYVWLIVNLISFIAWLPLVHRKFEPGLNSKWYTQDIFFIVFTVFIVGSCLNFILPVTNNRLWLVIQLLGFGAIVMIAGTFASSMVREKFIIFVNRSLDKI